MSTKQSSILSFYPNESEKLLLLHQTPKHVNETKKIPCLNTHQHTYQHTHQQKIESDQTRLNFVGELVIIKQPNEKNVAGPSRMVYCDVIATMYNNECQSKINLAQDIKIVPKTLDDIILPNFLNSCTITDIQSGPNCQTKIKCSFHQMELLKKSYSGIGTNFPKQIKLVITHPLFKSAETKPFSLKSKLN